MQYKQEYVKDLFRIVPALILIGLFFNWLNTPETITIQAKSDVLVESPVASPEATTAPIPDDVEGYIVYKFGEDDGKRAIKMLKECENKQMKLDALNWNGDGTYDFGLFQINSIHGYSKEQLIDFKFNTDIAYEIYKNAGNSFSPWTCSYVVGEIPFYLK